MKIQELKLEHIPMIIYAFAKSRWVEKSSNLFEKYLKEQKDEKRVVFLAFIDDQFAGYITLKWQSLYKPFAEKNIPEISDLNVLPSFRNIGIGSILMEKCEKIASKKSSVIGIGVGLYSDYGSAQRLYIKRGYMPDGLGATYRYEKAMPGAKYLFDDDLIIWFTKELLSLK